MNFLKKISIKEKYNFYEYISVMLDGGVSFGEIFDSVGSKLQNEFFKEKIKELQTFVSSGDSLSRSMKKMPMLFNDSEISIIESGEATGKLSQTLSLLSDNLKSTHELKMKIKAAMTYPVIIFIVLTVAILTVLMFVIPALSKLFMDSEVELPAATKALVATSDFIKYNWYVLIFFVLCGIFAFVFYKNTEKGRANLDYYKLKLPLVGKVYKNYILSHLSSNLGMLVSSGVPIVKSLELCARGAGNQVYHSYITEVKEKVSVGEKITTSLLEVDKAHEFFPLDYIQMLSVGEKTATLDKVCTKLSSQYTTQVNYSLANLTKWIEPIAIMISGVFVLWFAFAIFGAVLKVSQTVA